MFVSCFTPEEFGYKALIYQFRYRPIDPAVSLITIPVLGGGNI